ncbi:hypothetical protein D3C76_726510 [compost metagenome]
MTLRYCQILEQAQQGIFDVFGHRAIGRLGRVGQGVEHVLLGLLRIDRSQCLGDGRGQRQGIEQYRRAQFVGIDCRFSWEGGSADRFGQSHGL